MEKDLTQGGRLAIMLITASLVLPVLALCGILIMRHFFWVHYLARTMWLWLLLDGVILCIGLVVRENDTVATNTPPHRKPLPRRFR